MSRAKRHSVSIAILVVALVIALGPEVGSLTAWADATAPEFVGRLMRVTAAVVMAWLTRRPRTPRADNEFASRYLRGPGDPLAGGGKP